MCGLFWVLMPRDSKPAAQVVSFEVFGADWTVTSLLDRIAVGGFHALIDTGALITGLSNKDHGLTYASHLSPCLPDSPGDEAPRGFTFHGPPVHVGGCSLVESCGELLPGSCSSGARLKTMFRFYGPNPSCNPIKRMSIEI